VLRCVKGPLTQVVGHQITSQNQALGCATHCENSLETLAMEIRTMEETAVEVDQVAADGKGIVETVATTGLVGATRMIQVASNAQGLG